MLSIEDLQKSTIGILGFGKEGQAVARFLRRHGASARVFDTKAADSFTEVDWSDWEAAGFAFELGKPFSDLARSNILFRSPGVPRMSAALVDAESHGVIVTSQTKWFFDHCPARIIGVTGTKGKGTTVSLIARIIEEGKALAPQGGMASMARVFVTGNIGKLDPLDFIEELQSTDIVVFELSSFQLQDLTVSPWIGVCLMVTQEHLDHHSNVAEYQAAKASIASFQKEGDMLVFASDYPASSAIGKRGKGVKYSYGRQSQEKGLSIDGEVIRLSQMPLSGIVDATGRLLPGEHNMENIAAASGVGVLLGVPLSSIQNSIVGFPGLEHRLEYVGEFSGVRFYNDSISTIPESAIAAVRAFTQPIVLILGGSEKGSDFTELGQVVSNSQNIRGVIVVGEMTERIVTALQNAKFVGPCLTGPTSMSEIFAQVGRLALKGDVVLLSPACASFGMFKNYVQRGEQFKQAARAFTKS